MSSLAEVVAGVSLGLVILHMESMARVLPISVL